MRLTPTNPTLEQIQGGTKCSETRLPSRCTIGTAKRKMPAMKLKAAKSRWFGNQIGYGVDPPQYVSLARFCNSAESLFGLKPSAITPGPFNSGTRLTLSGGNRNYEVLVSGGNVLLGELKNDGQRFRLAVAVDTASGWQRLLQVLQQSEGRLPV
jgi:hypothetical protein